MKSPNKKPVFAYRLSQFQSVIYSVLLITFVLLPSIKVFAQSNPVPVQFFYVPLPEEHILKALQTVNTAGTASANPVQTYISIAAIANNTIIYYDQWENGYEPDISNPLSVYSISNPGGTQIWGDGNPANGAPPGIPTDIIKSGTTIILNNPVTTTTRQSVIDFDGSDKIAATKTISVARTGWTTGPNTLLADAIEVFDTNNWGTEFVVPVGEDIPNTDSYRIFNYTGLSILAGVGGATVQVDADANGSYETTITLAEGEGHLVDGGVKLGAKVISNNPVQIELLTGDRGEQYEARWYRLSPLTLWSSDYYEPVSTVASSATVVWLYNPNNSAITVQYRTRTGSGGNTISTTNISVPSKSYAKQVMTDGYGAQFSTNDGSKFYALSATDANTSTNNGSGANRSWDWGFTLVSQSALTQQILIGLGLGRDPTSGTNPNENGNPIYVTPIGNGNTAVTVYVDYDADPTTGPNTDPNGNKYDVALSLRELDRAKVYNPGGNQSGMLLYTLVTGVKLAAAWGQDPTTASSGAPGLDVGTGIPPLPLFDAGKSAVLSQDNDGDGFISPGDEILYTIIINNISRAPVPDIKLVDNFPANTSYVPNSTFFTNQNSSITQIPDNGSGTAFPLDGSGIILDNSLALAVGKSYKVTFKVKIKDFADLTPNTERIINTGYVEALNNSVGLNAQTPLFGKVGDKVWDDVNQNGIQDAGEGGLSGITVKLYDGSGNLKATTTTDSNGEYKFLGLLPGSYQVEFVKPSTYDFTTKNADALGLNGSANSDANTANGRTDVFTLAGGETNKNVDAGLIPNGSIGDKVWDDVNKNGIQDAGEGGIANVTVKLFDNNNNLIATTITDVNGIYEFKNVRPGDYYVEFSQPSGYVFTTQNLGDDNKDSDANTISGKTDQFSLSLGQKLTNIDAGLFENKPADLKLVKTVDNSTPLFGSNITYTITLTNEGPSDATNIVVKDVLPAGLVFISATPSTGTFTAPNWSVTSLTNGASATLTFIAKVNSLNAIINTAEIINSDQPDVDSTPNNQNPNEDDQSSVTINPKAVADLRVNKTVDNSSPILGSNVTFTITLTNDGPNTATNIVVEDLLAPGLTLVSATATSGSYTSPNWSIASLANGASATLTVIATVNSISGITNTAEVTHSDQFDPDSTPNNHNPNEDDQSSVTISPFDKADLRLQKTIDNNAPNFGSNVTYTVTLTNDGPNTATNIKVNDQLPAGLIFVSANTSSGNYSAPLWTIPSLASGSSTTLTIVATVNTTSAFTNTAEVIGVDQNDPDSTPNNQNPNEDDQASVPASPVALADLSLTKIVNNSTPQFGSNITYTVTLTNDGPNTATNVVVKDVLPAGLIFVSATPSSGTFNAPNWSIPSISVNTSYTLSIIATVNTASAVTNTAEIIAADQKDTDSTPNNQNPNEDDQASVVITPVSDADLSVIKTVSNSSPANGDQITYTIKIKNNGPGSVSSVELTDLLPSGLIFVSSNATQGSYSNITGKWNVGTLANNSEATLTITVKVDLYSCGGINLGAAKTFNLFVFGDLMQPSADTQGKIAVGGNASLSNYSVADLLPANSGDVLIVGKKLTYTSGSVNGNVVYGTTSNLPVPAVSVHGTVRQENNVIDFVAAEAALKALSLNLSTYTANGTTQFQWGGLTLTGTDPFINVFNVSGADLSNAHTVSISVPSGAVVLVNISGTNVSWKGGLTVDGTAINNVLYNFYQANTLNIQGIDVRGSILAPLANLNFPAGVVNGQVIVKTMTGSGQFNLAPFAGQIPCSPKITNCAEVTSSSLADPNVVNNKSCVEINVKSGSSGSGNNGGGNPSNGWTQCATFPANEVVWTIINDNSGNLLIGTVGGGVYKSVNGGLSWTKISNGLTASIVWSLAVNNSGAIYAGTEKGIFVTTNNGANWSGPLGNCFNDIRSLAIDKTSGTIYAGTWGFGIMKSADNGATWNFVNSGLNSLIVSSIKVDNSGKVYAGTFGGGVFVSSNFGSTWTKTNLPFEFVWAIDITSIGQVFAATYGSGVYKTADGGLTWTQINAGIQAEFVYAITITSNDDVYVGTWTGGIYKLTNANSLSVRPWEEVGMKGFGISSLLIDKNKNTLFAGGNNGAVYKSSTSITSVNSESGLPTVFSLKQNYPNPFNPTTTIEYSVPESGHVSLIIYNALGQVVAELVNRNIDAGNHKASFDASRLSSGVYIYKLVGSKVNISKKMILMK